MKDKIHPDVKKSQVRCACGNTFETLSTKEKTTVEICAKCHPIFTGREKLRDSAGRVEKFFVVFGSMNLCQEKFNSLHHAQLR